MRLGRKHIIKNMVSSTLHVQLLVCLFEKMPIVVHSCTAVILLVDFIHMFPVIMTPCV